MDLSLDFQLSVPLLRCEVLVFLRKTKTSKRYIVGWVRFFCKAKKRHPTKTSKRYIVGWVRFFCKAKKRHPTERDKCWVTLFR
jgi:hypothetical protein